MAASMLELSKRDKDLLSQLECPVCLETSLPPIYMCVNGHNICSNCKLLMAECPTCREPGTPNTRNIFAERFCTQFTVPCTNKKYGCKKVVMKEHHDEHILDCMFRFTCVYCNGYRSDLPLLKRHLTDNHVGFYDISNTWEGLLPSRTCTVSRYLACYDGLFGCGIKTCDDGLGLFTRYIGPREDAAKFKCRMRFVSEDETFECSYMFPCITTEKEITANVCRIMCNENVVGLKRKDGFVFCRITIVKIGLEKIESGEVGNDVLDIATLSI